jgi:hypothetical protein
MSTKRNIDDGGPAFPVAEDHKVAADIPWTCGMSLRDWFAGQALAGGMSAADATDANIARAAYRLADSMLEVRSGMDGS